jgi:hypothetical protein
MWLARMRKLRTPWRCSSREAMPPLSAVQLAEWEAHGFVTLRQALSAPELDRIEAAMTGHYLRGCATRLTPLQLLTWCQHLPAASAHHFPVHDRLPAHG